MKISTLIETLKKIQEINGDNIEVLYQDGDGDSIWEIMRVEVRFSADECFPEEWNMPDKFVRISA